MGMGRGNAVLFGIRRPEGGVGQTKDGEDETGEVLEGDVGCQSDVSM